MSGYPACRSWIPRPDSNQFQNLTAERPTSITRWVLDGEERQRQIAQRPASVALSLDAAVAPASPAIALAASRAATNLFIVISSR